MSPVGVKKKCKKCYQIWNYNNLGKCGGNVGKSHFLRRNYGKLSFFEGGIITTSAL
jgi:hypothetical protein